MTPERWAKIEGLYHQALERKAQDRGAFLAQACAGDPELRGEVESLLASSEGAEAFLEAPAVQVAAQAVLREQSRRGLAGKTVSHYRVVEKLGGGGMGEVYRAEDIKLGRPVALKFLRTPAWDRTAVERFKREARAASVLTHPNICTVFDIDEFEDEPFIVMELLDGQTLKQRIQSGGISLEQLLDLAIQMTDAMDAAHARGILHRDIKPSNIFITTRGQVKILDFGLAKLVPEGAPGGGATAPTLTMPTLTVPGVVLGTAPYMSPEQARGEDLDGRSDVFSFGAVLYEMATRRKAFRADTRGVVLEAVSARDPTPAGQVDPGVPARLQDIIAKAMEKDRDLRYQHFSDLRADLKRLKREMDAARSTPAAQSSQPTRLGRYQINGQLGVGGMGAVYQGVDPAIGRAVAIKTILPSRMRSPNQAPQLRERLLREARAAGALAHPNIVAVHDVGEEAGVTYIVMEYVRGVTLDELLRRTQALLPAAQSMAILEASALALDFAHARGVVHRDVKPSNIMIQDDGAVKLADFGTARLVAAPPITAPGSVTGSPYFMSPEQLRAQETTAASDQYSLAVVAWMLLTGSRPFDANQLGALAYSILTQEPPRSNLLSAAADAALRRALAKNPEARFPSCSAFVAALRAACLVTPAEPKPAKQRAPLWLMAVAVVLMLAFGAATYKLLEAQRPAAPEKKAVTVAVPAQPSRPDPVPVQPKAPVAVKPDLPTVQPKEKFPAERETPPVSGAAKINPADGLAYVWIPPGSFDMGCSAGDHDCGRNEKPPHHVAIRQGFWMGQTEVTVKAYRRFASATHRFMPAEPIFSERPLNPGWTDDRQPIVGVSWDDARSFCEWAHMRLPTEAEWEYAARGGDSRPRYGSPDLIAWYANNSGRAVLDSNTLWRDEQAQYVQILGENGNGPHHVGEKAGNEFGLRDILGNVWEWVSDWYEEAYYSHSPDADPPGPASGAARVLRGGSWYNGSKFIRASARHQNPPGVRSNYNGIRCAGSSLPGSR